MNLMADSPYKELLVRVASAIVLVPTTLGLIAIGGGAFLVLISVAISFLALEWSLMATPKLCLRVAVAITLSALAAIFATYLGHPFLGLALLLFGAACSGLFVHKLQGSWIDAAYGVLYIGIPGILLVWLRGVPHGVFWVIFVYVIAWTADSAAYLGGKLIGGPRLWRRFSPNKTWAGFVCGLIAGMLAAAFMNDAMSLFSRDASVLLIGLLLAGSTMAGDLWESMLKRRYGVKDTGRLIPGHGGLLDRVDGLMFAIVVMAGLWWLVSKGVFV